MTFYLTTTAIGRAILGVCAGDSRDDIGAPTDWSDLETISLFVALGLTLTAVFFCLGFGVEIGRILAASG